MESIYKIFNNTFSFDIFTDMVSQYNQIDAKTFAQSTQFIRCGIIDMML